MTLRDRYRDLIDQGTSTLPDEPEAFARLEAARKPPRPPAPSFALAAAGLAFAGSIAIAILSVPATKPRPAQTMSIYVALSDRPGEAMEIVITTAEPETHP